MNYLHFLRFIHRHFVNRRLQCGVHRHPSIEGRTTFLASITFTRIPGYHISWGPVGISDILYRPIPKLLQHNQPKGRMFVLLRSGEDINF
eukprot:CFRG0501T1